MIASTKDDTLVAELVSVLKLGAYVGGGGIGQSTQTKARVEGSEPVKVLVRDSGCIFLDGLGQGRPDRVAEIVDEDFTVSGLLRSPWGNVIEGLIRSAQPAPLVVPDCTNSVEFQ